MLTGKGWEDVPADIRKQAESPWFASFLAFDPAPVIGKLDQPLFVIQGALDTQVPPHHAEKLGALANARKKAPKTEVVVLPGINHLLVPAKTGDVSEYGVLLTARSRRKWRRRSPPGSRRCRPGSGAVACLSS